MVISMIYSGKENFKKITEKSKMAAVSHKSVNITVTDQVPQTGSGFLKLDKISH